MNTTKQLRDALVLTKTGTTTLQQTRYEVAKSELDYFVREKDESPQDLNECLNTLASQIKSFEHERGDDGFTITGKFLVDKLLTALAPRYKNMVWSIRREHGFSTMTLDNLIGTILQYDEHELNGKKQLVMQEGSQKDQPCFEGQTCPSRRIK